MSLLRQKLVAFGTHLGLSLCVVGAFVVVSYYLIYTPPVLALEGGDAVTLLILGVDLTVGPLLTFILYRKGKPGLRFDLTVVVLMQVAAFLYGAWTLYSQRPLYLAFVVEHFHIIPAASIDLSTLSDPALKPGILAGPKPVFVERASGEERNKILLDALFGGKDVDYYPAQYRPFAEHLDEVREHALTLEGLRKERPGVVPPLEQSLHRLGRDEDDTLFIPIIGHRREGAVALDRDSGEILDFIDAVIW